MAEPAHSAPSLDRKGLSGPALRTFFRIAELWRLSVTEQMTLLGLSARSTYFKWKKDPEVALPRDTLERISYIIGVYKALQILLPDEKAADEWVKRPNAAPPFNGRSALDRMMSGQVADLFLVAAIPRRAARRLGMTPPTARIAWKPSWRIVPSRFPPIQLFERVTEPRDLEAIFELEALTNPRLRDEVGNIRLVPPQDRVSGPGTSVIMAAFTHLNPNGSRFSDGAYGVFYTGKDLEVAIAETRHHRERFMRATAQPRMELDMRVYLVDLEGELHDLRGQRAAHNRSCTTPTATRQASSSGKRCATQGPTASPTTAFAGPGANAPPCSGRRCSKTSGRSGTCATPGTARESPPSTRSGNSRATGKPERFATLAFSSVSLRGQSEHPNVSETAPLC